MNQKFTSSAQILSHASREGRNQPVQRRQANEVRITTQLIRVSDGFHLWSETYDHTLEKDPTRRAFIAVEQVLFSDDWTTLVDRIDAMLSVPGCPSPVWTELITILGYDEALAPMWGRSMR